jgi:hypothetical protein
MIADVRGKRPSQAAQQLMDRGAALRKWLNRLASRVDKSGVDRWAGGLACLPDLTLFCRAVSFVCFYIFFGGAGVEERGGKGRTRALGASTGALLLCA